MQISREKDTYVISPPLWIASLSSYLAQTSNVKRQRGLRHAWGTVESASLIK